MSRIRPFAGEPQLQRILGFSALVAGLAFVPLAVSAGVGGLLTAPLIDRIGVRAVAAAASS